MVCSISRKLRCISRLMAIGRPLDVADEPFLLLDLHPGTGLAHLIKVESRGVQPQFLCHHIGRAIGLGRIRLPVVAAAYGVKTGMGLLTGDGANRSGFVHSVSHIDGALLGDILRLHPLGQLIGDGQWNRALLHQGGDDLLRQPLLGGQGLLPLV